ncbi:MAG TPA: hypothetical protein VFB96_06465 [Pirellulaceae bacterium]|nr:hypothetical protein [Pirellulaceae bacterium]
MSVLRGWVSLLLAILLPTAALACLWDSETLKQERARFPSVLELITGKFLRHSKEFHEWRIKDRQNKLASDPGNIGYYDDIAVSYEKIGRHDKAIETILAKENIQPGLYETYSNLGTFHILAGDFEKGLPYIDKALAINPNAHFGREMYQKWLVEYAMSRMSDGKLSFPLGSGRGFAVFLARRWNQYELSEEDSKAAVTGVLGMMRFANHENPLLLEALGDLLLDCQGGYKDAKQLAARAYLKASYVVTGVPRQKYRELAQQALILQTREGIPQLRELPLQIVEAEFQQELDDADRWYGALHRQEQEWIREGVDVDLRFDWLYANEPAAIFVSESALQTIPRLLFGTPERTLAYLTVVNSAILTGVLALLIWRRKSGESTRATG